jgi:preprotein translocase subunit SecG
VVLLLGIALVVAVIVVAVLVLTSSGNSPSTAASSSSSSASTTAAKRASGHKRHTTAPASAAAVTPSSVTVAVLNGTTTNNLAHDVLGKLTATGYKGGPTANAAENGVSSTVVGYTQPAYRNDALAVAKSLNLGTASVQGVSQGDRTAACGAVATCPAQVVVTAGSDLPATG